jgi:Ca2+-binding RTX toxin-like protein
VIPARAYLSLTAALLVAAALVEVAPTSAGNDARCFGKAATITAPDSRLVEGSQEADVIVAGNRVNLVEGKGGADLICAGEGEDVVRGGPGNDQISGEGHNDLLYGSGGDDRIYGRQGADVLDGKAGHDLCVGGSGADLAAARRCDRIRGADPSES